MDSLAKLQIFAIGGCRIIGEIPSWLIKLKSLELMDLSQNRLVGSIPSREPATTSEDDELKRTLVAGSAIGYLFGFSSILFVRAWRV